MTIAIMLSVAGLGFLCWLAFVPKNVAQSGSGPPTSETG